MREDARLLIDRFRLEFRAGEPVATAEAVVEPFRISVLDLDFMLGGSVLEAVTEPADFRFFEVASATIISRGLLTPVELMGGLEPELALFIGE